MTRIIDLDDVGVEHMLGATTSAGLVKIRCKGVGAVLLGIVEPQQAREIAAHLFEAAARAEYEQDLWRASKAAGVTDAAIGCVLQMVRQGEERRLS